MKTVLKSDLESVQVMKLDTDQRLVTYWANVTKMNGEIVVDSQGEYIETEDLQHAMIDFMRYFRELKKAHDKNSWIGTVVEAITFTKELKEFLGIADAMPQEGALITAYIHDEPTWNEIKAGMYPMASIGGRAMVED